MSCVTLNITVSVTAYARMQTLKEQKGLISMGAVVESAVNKEFLQHINCNKGSNATGS